MIRIKRRPTDPGWLPEIHPAGQGSVAAGAVYVAKTVDGVLQQPQLETGQKAVLEVGSQHAEVKTSAVYNGTVSADGTYLNAVDYAKFTSRDKPTLRLYTSRDSLHKMMQIPGLVLLLPALGATLTAIAGIFFVWSSQAQPTPSAVAGTAQTVLAWAGQPTDQFDAPVSAAQITAVHQQLDARSQEAEWCLLAIEGQHTPSVTIPGVTCAPVTVPWWRSALAGSLITGAIAVCTALVGIVALRSKYGFQKSPDG
jgi:hypothetical protein